MAITNRAQLDADEFEPSGAYVAGAAAVSALRGPARFARDRVWDQPGFEAIGGIKPNHDWRVLHQWSGDSSAEDQRFAPVHDDERDEDDDGDPNYNLAPSDRPPRLRGPMLELARPVGSSRRRGHGQSAWASLQQQQRRNVTSARADDDGVLGV